MAVGVIMLPLGLWTLAAVFVAGGIYVAIEETLEDALCGMREYYREHVISGVLYKQVEDALGETLSQPGNRGPDEVRPPDGGRSPVGEQPLIRRPSGIG